MSTSGGPYVGLDYFLEEDAELFFGRDGERKRIIGNLRASRLTLLYAESGVGKSSLLRAGVSARLHELGARSVAAGGTPRYVPVVFSSWQGDATAGLIAALEDAVRPMVDGDGDLRRDALEHALEDVARMVDATPLLILDQFEEHFVQEPHAGNGFDEDLARCITRPDLRANVLIAVREDAYSLLGQRFKATIPNVYGNYLHLDFLDEHAARVAVLEPVRAFNERLPDGVAHHEIEPDLVAAVLEQVRRGRVTIGDAAAPDLGASGPARIETAYLQLVMKRIWDEEVALGSTRLRLETLQRLGGADTIVRSHLDDVMNALPGEQRDAAAAAFRFLVTSGGRKIALSTAELGEFSDAPEAPLDAALGHLEDERILRRIPSDGVPRREIYHDVLAPAILDWRRRHVEDQRRAETERGLAEARTRTRRLEVRSRRLAATVIALAAVLAGVALYLLDPTPVRRLELGTIDARFALRGTSAPDPRLVIVTVDDRTLQRFAGQGDPRLPREEYAAMIRQLHEAGASLIALDVVFQDPWTPRGDRALLRAFRATKDRLVVPFETFVAETSPDGAQRVRADVIGEWNLVRGSGVKTGYAGLPQDVDGTHRRTDLLVSFVNEKPAEGDARDSVRAPTFAFAAADLVRGGALGKRPEDQATAAGREEGAQSDLTSWIDYRGPSGTVPSVSALDVLESRRDAETFRGKLVVIGVTATGSPDVHRTPVDRGEGPMPGAEIQANAIDTLLQSSPLRDAPNPLDVIAMVLLACIPALAALSRSRRFPAIAIALTAVAFIAWVQVAFLLGWIVAVVVPLVAFLAATAGVAGVAAGRALRRRRASVP